VQRVETGHAAEAGAGNCKENEIALAVGSVGVIDEGVEVQIRHECVGLEGRESGEDETDCAQLGAGRRERVQLPGQTSRLALLDHDRGRSSGICRDRSSLKR
jgi:hypothetical protein